MKIVVKYNDDWNMISMSDSLAFTFGDIVLSDIENKRNTESYVVSNWIAILSLRVKIKEGKIDYNKVILKFVEKGKTTEVKIDKNGSLSAFPKCTSYAITLLSKLF